MKKLKLLPTILMLVLCVGVLAIGIYAVTPTKNTISGSITINSSNQPVTIKIYEGSTSGTKVVEEVVRSGNDNINFGTGITFKTTSGEDLTSANTLTDVAPIVYVIELSTTSEEKLVVDTETVQQFNAVKYADETTVVKENAVSLTKNHTPTATDKATGKNGASLAYFTKDKPYTITCTMRLASFVQEQCKANVNFKLDIYKASEYECEGINGIDYLYFGSFPQTLATTTTGLTDTGRTFEAYDDTTGGTKQNPIYNDASGNEYVLLSGKYYKIEPLKWTILKNTDGTAELLCDNVVEQVCYRKNYLTEKVGTTTYYYATGADGNKIENTKEGISTDDDASNNYIYANNYEYSDLRTYLNNTFYNGAFTDAQKLIIPKTDVDNTTLTEEESNNFSSENKYLAAQRDTNDYVYALRFADVVTSPNFSTDSYNCDINRMKQTTAYARATGAGSAPEYTVESFVAEHDDDNCGCGNYTVQDIVNNCWGYSYPSGVSVETFVQNYSLSGGWFLRSPYYLSSIDARRVYSVGDAYSGYYVHYTRAGCVPALRLSLVG